MSSSDWQSSSSSGANAAGGIVFSQSDEALLREILDGAPPTTPNLRAAIRKLKLSIDDRQGGRTAKQLSRQLVAAYRQATPAPPANGESYL